MRLPLPLKVPDKLLVALGGNAIHPEGIKGTGKEQVKIAAQASKALLPLLQHVKELIITHGNGPGVGKVLMRQAIARKRVVAMPLDICVANSQGGISYVIMQALENAMKVAAIDRKITSIICEVEVDPRDRAFSTPEKPVGYFFDNEEAKELTQEFGWKMKEDAGRGWRLVVPSPRPLKILNSDIIGDLARKGIAVITAGGGGIPVSSNEHGQLSGLEAVIDKDFTSALLARELEIDTLLILTAISHVAIDYGTENQQNIEEISLKALRQLAREGHFSSGSMAPKVEAAMQFLENGGSRVAIGHLDSAYDTLIGKTGTQIVQ